MDSSKTNGKESVHPPEAKDPLTLHEYATWYSGRALIARLLFIAPLCRAEAVKVEALTLQEVKRVRTSWRTEECTR
jgi:hypothetical protein